jgi:dTDP-glucose 4,6-dehydratase
MDNFLTGRADNVADLVGERFRLVNVNVTDFIHVPGPLDAVLHFASPASPIDYLKYPIQTLKVGALGTHHALGLAKEKQARFLLASTSEVYGDPRSTPARDLLGPRQPHRPPRRLRRGQALRRGPGHGLPPHPRGPGAHVRIFNTYGPS